MSVALEIVPSSASLDMIGESDVSSAYSLSGHVSITLHSSAYFFDRRRPVRLLLESLQLTFEGQSELLTPTTGYHPFRLCSVVRELAPTERVELSNEGHEDADKPCAWNVVFDLPIPGWLPPSAIFGDTQHGAAGVSYALHASAKFTAVEEGPACPRSFFSVANLCSLLAPKLRIVSAPRQIITINRACVRPVANLAASTVFPTVNFGVESRADNTTAERDDTYIPLDVLENIHVVASVPSHVSIDDETSLPLSIRIRGSSLTEDQTRRLRVTDFTVDMEQHERYRTFVPAAYRTTYPVPGRSSQPPRRPLLNPHPLQALYDIGLVTPPTGDQALLRTFSLLPSDCSGHYSLAGDGYIFTSLIDDADTPPAPHWYALETRLPFVHLDGEDAKIVVGAGVDAPARWLAVRALRPTAETPHLVVRHTLSVAMTCTWDVDAPGTAPAVEGAEPRRATERVHFSVPISFVHVLPPAPPLDPRAVSPFPSLCSTPAPAPPSRHRRCPSSLSLLSDSDDSDMGDESTSRTPLLAPPPLPLRPAGLLPPSMPYATSCALPAYSQLFYANGDRKVDYDLPMYTPREEASSASLQVGA